jgi:uncharacterized membrane protein YfcA
MPDLGINLSAVAFAIAVVLLAYFVLGVSGFGSAIIAVPLLTHVLPIQQAVTQIVLIDLTMSFLIGRKSRREINREELKWLMPFAAIGMVVGVTLLIRAPSNWLLGVLAVFTLLNGIRGFVDPHKVKRSCHKAWGSMAGLIAGGFSALYGTGGPIYAIYLSNRRLAPQAMRATMSALVFLNVWFRVATLSLAGLLLTPQNLSRTMVLIPFALIAVLLGTRFQGQLSPPALKRFFSSLLIGSGLTILPRVLT